jgi:FAD/FMN-containing dehydrogenase
VFSIGNSSVLPKSIEIEAIDAHHSRDNRYQSWGRHPKVAHRRVAKVYWRDQIPELLQRAEPGSLLPYGMGRSYGDSCLNDNRDLLDCSAINRILDFDWETGRIRVESGMMLGDLLEVIVPHGWFLPVTPGTKFVTIGGAIANDVHGKNHHRAGTFGNYVEQLMLYRSDSEPVACSPSSNADLFQATIGGLGLTGVIGWADLRLKRITGNTIDSERLPFTGLDEFLSLSSSSDEQFEYTVAWIDCLARSRMRGLIFRGNHGEGYRRNHARGWKIPFTFPEFLLSRRTVTLFNAAYQGLNARNAGRSVVHYDKFFYPLDSVLNWNRLYGRRGLVQYQCVVPRSEAEAVKHVVERVSASGEGCFLAVLKLFGEIPSPGMLSFPRPGLTLALDLPMRGRRTLALLDSLDELVLASGGALYPAKDARMSAAMFQTGFPNWKSFEPFIDAKLSSSFWRRVAQEGTA